MTPKQQAMMEQLRKDNQAKSSQITYISSAVRSLRAPLNSIKGFADLLLLGLDGDLPQEAHNDVQLISKNSQLLIEFVNDILDICHLGTEYLEITPKAVKVQEVVQQAIADTELFLANNSVQIIYRIFDDVSQVWADPIRLKQILLNLINNSFKFTHEGQITIEVKEYQDETVCFSIIDTEIGIPKAKQAHIFEAFGEDSGLGLPICKEFVTLHQGKIWLESNEGQGTAVHFTIPIAASSGG